MDLSYKCLAYYANILLGYIIRTRPKARPFKYFIINK